jgi:maleylacetate reductase
MPRTLKEVGVARDDLPRLAENCMLDDWTFSNPRIISSPDQIMDILEATMG